MPVWAYSLPAWQLALLIFVVLEAATLLGLTLARHFLLPRFKLGPDSNDTVTGVAAATGVFYGIAVSLIAVSVWASYAEVGHVASREAAAIGTLYRDVSGYPEPQRQMLRDLLRQYTENVITRAWPAHSRGEAGAEDSAILNDFQARLITFEPTSEGQSILHLESVRAYNDVIEHRRLRVAGVDQGLPGSLWIIIWLGALISMSVVYFYSIEDHSLHAVLIGLMAAFIALVIWIIAIHDQPFKGDLALQPDAYQIIINEVMNRIP